MVSWDQITAECDGYRVGFVAVFRKYEGQPTDEKDGQGRKTKVTTRSFALHCGIDPRTFGRWAKEKQVRHDVASGPARTGQMARQAVKSEKVSVDDKVGMLDDLTSDPKVMGAWQKNRAPVVTKEDAKAAEAVAKSFTQPLLNAAGAMQVPMWVDQLDAIAQGIAEHDLPADAIRKLDKAVSKVTEEIEVKKFGLGLEVS